MFLLLKSIAAHQTSNCYHYLYRPALAAFLFIIGLSSLVSCTTAKNTSYFSDITDSQLVKLPVLQRSEQVIMPDDQLEIKIVGSNEITTQVFNSFAGSATSAGGTVMPVYTVDGNGDIELAYIGKVKAAGYTRDVLKERLKSDISKYLKDVMVSVRFSNFRFTVLGEVRLPGSYLLPSDKVTVLEALGQAGDLTQFAKRNNVKVIRDSSGNRQIGTMDFTKKNVFTSPFFYLQRNDVVYVEPNKNKGQNEQYSKVATIVTTLASLIAITLAIFRSK